MGKLDGKVAIVTGSGRGIGKAYAKAFAKEGAAVTVTCRTDAQGMAVVKEIAHEGGRAIYVKADITNPDDIKKVVSETVKTFGKINILVNNAQIEGPQQQFVESVRLEDIEPVWKSGYVATLLFQQECFPYLKETKGNIINTGSGAATLGLIDKAIYGPVKSAIMNLTLITARAWGKYGITCNVIMPGVVTEMYKKWKEQFPEHATRVEAEKALGRFGEPEEIAPIAVFLASDDSKYFTGQILHADGGTCFVR